MVTTEHKRIDDEKKAETEISKPDSTPKKEVGEKKKSPKKQDDGSKQTTSK